MGTADAAKNTSDLIEGTVKRATEGANLVVKTNDAFEEVTENSSKVGSLVVEISSASKEQADGIGQVTTVVSEMDSVAQENAAGLEKLSSQANELSRQVGIMLKIVEGKKSGQTDAQMSSQGMRMLNHENKKMKQIAEKLEGKKEIRPDQVILFDENEEDFKNF